MQNPEVYFLVLLHIFRTNNNSFQLFQILNKKYVGDSAHATEPANAKKAKLRLGKYTLIEKRGNEEYESEHFGFIVKTE
jgi:hypothetical protein